MAQKNNKKPSKPTTEEKPEEEQEEITADIAEDFDLGPPKASLPAIAAPTTIPATEPTTDPEIARVQRLYKLLGITAIQNLVTEQAKMMDGIIRELQEIRGAVTTNAQTLTQVVEYVNTGKVSPPKPQQAQISAEEQEGKLLALAEVAKSFGEAYRTIKSPVSEGGGFEKMMAEWGAKMFQYHLDSMAQSVYQIRLPHPASAISGARIPVMQPTEPAPGHSFD